MKKKKESSGLEFNKDRFIPTGATYHYLFNDEDKGWVPVSLAILQPKNGQPCKVSVEFDGVQIPPFDKIAAYGIPGGDQCAIMAISAILQSKGSLDHIFPK